MVSISVVRNVMLSFPETVELPHFEKASFRLGTKIIATISERDKKVCVKLSEEEQALFSSHDPQVIYAVPNKWGKQGWTFIELTRIKKPVLVAILSAAYEGILKKKSTRRKKSPEKNKK
jgi:hypothetical protein